MSCNNGIYHYDYLFLEISDNQFSDEKLKVNFFNCISFYKCKTFHWDLDGRNQARSYVVFWFWITKQVNHTNGLLPFSDHQKSDAKLKVNNFLLNSLWQVEIFRKRYWWRKSSFWLHRKMSLNMEINQFWLHVLELSYHHNSELGNKMNCWSKNNPVQN